jgi:hypothetical protein
MRRCPPDIGPRSFRAASEFVWLLCAVLSGFFLGNDHSAAAGSGDSNSEAALKRRKPGRKSRAKSRKINYTPRNFPESDRVLIIGSRLQGTPLLLCLQMNVKRDSVRTRARK